MEVGLLDFLELEVFRHDDECAEGLQLLIEVDGAESALEGVSDVVIVRFYCQFEQGEGLILGEWGHYGVELDIFSELLS